MILTCPDTTAAYASCSVAGWRNAGARSTASMSAITSRDDGERCAEPTRVENGWPRHLISSPAPGNRRAHGLSIGPRRGRMP